MPSPFRAHLKFTAENALELIKMTHGFTDLKLLSPVQLTQHLSCLGVLCPQPKRQPPRWHCSTAEASPSSVTVAVAVPIPCCVGLRPPSSLHSLAGACTKSGLDGMEISRGDCRGGEGGDAAGLGKAAFISMYFLPN